MPGISLIEYALTRNVQAMLGNGVTLWSKRGFTQLAMSLQAAATSLMSQDPDHGSQ
jgi:hypothetical protein